MRAVLFDVDGVLIHGYHARPELRKCWDENIEADLGISRDSFKEKFIFGPFVHEVLVEKRDMKEALAFVLPQLGYNDDPQHVIDYWLKKDACVNTPLLEMVKQIHASQKARLFIATNQEHNRASYLMTELGFNRYFDDIYHSGHIGHKKPDDLYFQTVSALLGELDEPPVFFDDTPEVVIAARKYGWDAYEFNDVDDLKQDKFIAGILG